MSQIHHSARIIEINASQEGQRIDNFLIKHLKNIPKSHIYRLLRSGQVRVNSGRKKPTYKLRSGDKLRIPPLRQANTQASCVPDAVLETLQSSILHEDDDILVINKPSGIAVHKGSGLHFGIIEAFRQLRPEQPLELVHRLDRETSGCLLLAKNRQILNHLHALFRQDITDKTRPRIEKTYLALVCGRWPNTQNSSNRRGGKPPPSSLTVQSPLAKVKQGGEHRMITVDASDPTAMNASSHFSVVESFADCTLMSVRIDTGRMHQIRVHAASTGHPIAGDSRYGDRRCNKQHRQQGLKRLFLHARRLILPLQDIHTIEAPLPAELETYLSACRTEPSTPSPTSQAPSSPASSARKIQ